MKMSEHSDCPLFAEAIIRFQAFLRECGWPTEIAWVRTLGDRDITVESVEAECDYEAARRRGFGVCLDGLRIENGMTVAQVMSPRDADEAERGMYPSNGSLKLSVALLDNGLRKSLGLFRLFRVFRVW
jgi:hypothetical protein